MRTFWPILGAALAAASLAGGCGGPLTMDLTYMTDALAVNYSLTPDGRLTISEGGGFGSTDKSRPLYRTRLEPAGLAKLKNAIQR